jgi:hypothetical protein
MKEGASGQLQSLYFQSKTIPPPRGIDAANNVQSKSLVHLGCGLESLRLSCIKISPEGWMPKHVRC